MLTGSASCLVDCAAGMIYVRGAATSAVDRAGLAAAPPACRAGTRWLCSGHMAMPAQLSNDLDRWGYEASRVLALMGELKARWDPAGILNRGVFVV